MRVPHVFSNRPSTTAHTTVEEQFIQITHPFHPLHGQRFKLLSVRQAWGEYRVYFYDDNGDLKLLPAGWTDVDPLDPFITQSNGRAHFLPSALLTLSHLLAGLQERRDADGG